MKHGYIKFKEDKKQICRIIYTSIILLTEFTACISHADGTSSRIDSAKVSYGQKLKSKRIISYKAFINNFNVLREGCGPQFSEGRTRSVWFPVGSSQVFYTEDFGIHMAIRIVGGKPLRLWCMSEAEQHGSLLALSNYGTYWKHIFLNEKKQSGKQVGDFPNIVSQMDGFVSFAQQNSVILLNKNGLGVCQNGPTEIMGLSYPEITLPCF